MRKKLFTPGPLTTSDTVRAAMNADWGSRDAGFSALTARVRSALSDMVNGGETHTTVPVQGAGTFAVEAAIATLVGPEDRLLVLINGEYGRRIADIARRMGKDTETLAFDDLEPVDPDVVSDRLAKSPKLTKVALVQLETTTGILNPVKAIAAQVAACGADLLLDAMSGFGCYPLDVAALPATAVIASSNKGLHGVPGIGFVIVNQDTLAKCAGHSPSLSLDLYDQWVGFQKNGQWRFTPPTQCLAALDTAITEYLDQGGQPARRARYEENARLVTDHLAELGFDCLVPENVRSAVILTFGRPAWFDFDHVYAQLARQGYYLYPGKLTTQPSFRIGCIGDLDPQDFLAMLKAFGAEVAQLKDAQRQPIAS